MSNLIAPETMREHRATWWVYAGTDRIRREKTMRGQWGHDVTCSCGWDSKTGGALQRYVADELWHHRYDEQCEKERNAAK